MIEQKMMDHLFRHQYGKMVSILTRIFGLTHLETIEDAVQDTFATAVLAWRTKMPDNPEAWLTKAAKNRAIDLFRKLNAEQKRTLKLESGPASMTYYDLFLDDEIADSQLRMIFTACHPVLNPKDQISFSLKTISGFSSKEIAAALLLKEETIKKRLTRARQSIAKQSISFEIPSGNELPNRLHRVLEVLYLIFNEGFHSTKKEILIREDLCGEAIRLCKMLLEKQLTRMPEAYALFALMCFHAARLPAKVNTENEIIDLKHQDRTKWYFPLIALGNEAMNQAVECENFSTYHYEAAIAAEHLKAASFEETNWEAVLNWYEKLYEIQPSTFTLLNIAVVQLQRKRFTEAQQILAQIDPGGLEQRAYLYYGTLSEYYALTNKPQLAIEKIDAALKLVKNESERTYLEKKRNRLL